MPRMRLLCGLSSTQNDRYFIYDNYNVPKYISFLPILLMVIVVYGAFYPIRVYLTVLVYLAYFNYLACLSYLDCLSVLAHFSFLASL